jgi:hypothetical protein
VGVHTKAVNVTWEVLNFDRCLSLSQGKRRGMCLVQPRRIIGIILRVLKVCGTDLNGQLHALGDLLA